MQWVKFGLTSRVAKLFGAIFCAVIPLVFVAAAPAQPTNLAVTVRHAPSLNGNGRIEGSLQQLLASGECSETLRPEAVRLLTLQIPPLHYTCPAKLVMQMDNKGLFAQNQRTMRLNSKGGRVLEGGTAALMHGRIA